MPIVHYCIRTECAPGKADLFIALCGCRLENVKETATNMTRITCEECRRKLGL
jgi:hypothetical protein